MGTKLRMILPCALGRMPKKVRSRGRPSPPASLYMSKFLSIYVEVPQQSHAITINIEDATAESTDTGVPMSVVTLREFQGHLVSAFGERQCVREMPPTLAGIQRRVQWHCITFSNRIGRTYECISSQEIGVSVPLPSNRILPRRRPTRSNSDRPDSSGTDRHQFNST